MLTIAENRFLRYWEEQRQGGKWVYLFQYSLVGTFMLSLIISILLLLFYNIYAGSPAFWLVPGSALVVSVLYAVISWYRYEKKWKQIIRREVNAGRKNDQSST